MVVATQASLAHSVYHYLTSLLRFSMDTPAVSLQGRQTLDACRELPMVMLPAARQE